MTTNNFRLQCKKIHMTYKTHVPLEPLLNYLVEILGPLKWYSLVHENGSTPLESELPITPPENSTPTTLELLTESLDGTTSTRTGDNPDPLILPASKIIYPHTHVALECLQKPNIRNPRKLDYMNLHPNVKCMLTKEHVERVWKYHEKDPVKLLRSEYCPVVSLTLFEEIINAKSLVEAVKIAKVEIKSILDVKILRSDLAVDPVIPPLSVTYSWTLQAPTDFAALFITGPTGTGKTRWALAQFEYPLLVSLLEDLKGFRADRHDGIVFDDMCFSHLSPQVAIHLLDWELPRSLNVKYGSITIPAHTRKILTSNELFETVFPTCTKATMQALLRRIKVIEVKTRLFTRTDPEDYWPIFGPIQHSQPTTDAGTLLDRSSTLNTPEEAYTETELNDMLSWIGGMDF